MSNNAADNRLHELTSGAPSLTFEATATFASANAPFGWEAAVTAYNHDTMGALGDKAGGGKTPDGHGFETPTMAIAVAAEAFQFSSE